MITETLNLISYFQKLRVHIVIDCAEIVIDYADTDKTTRTLSGNLEGFLQILVEQSGEKGIYVCLHTQQQQFQNMKTSVSI